MISFTCVLCNIWDRRLACMLLLLQRRSHLLTIKFSSEPIDHDVVPCFATSSSAVQKSFSQSRPRACPEHLPKSIQIPSPMCYGSSIWKSNSKRSEGFWNRITQREPKRKPCATNVRSGFKARVLDVDIHIIPTDSRSRWNRSEVEVRTRGILSVMRYRNVRTDVSEIYNLQPPTFLFDFFETSWNGDVLTRTSVGIHWSY